MMKKTQLGLLMWIMCLGLSCSKQDTYDLKIRFDNIEGLKQKDPVIFKGIEIGRIMSFTLSNDSVLVHTLLDTAYELQKDSKFSIASQNLFGDRMILIEKGLDFDFLSDGDIVNGTIEKPFNFELENPEKLLDMILNPCDLSDSLLVEIRRLNTNLERLNEKK